MIREFKSDDYEALVAVQNAVYPDYKTAVDTVRRWDEQREAKIRWGRFLAEADGEVVAWASFANSAWTFHPQKLWLELGVHPDHRGRGIGKALY